MVNLVHGYFFNEKNKLDGSVMFAGLRLVNSHAHLPIRDGSIRQSMGLREENPTKLLFLGWGCENVYVDTSGSNQWMRWMP